jgi:hypothetical protein
MNRFGLAAVALGGVLLAGGAFATGTVVDFHGAKVMAAITTGDEWAVAGLKSHKELKIGPYDTDAAVFLTWSAASYRQPNSGAGFLHIELQEDGVNMTSTNPYPDSANRSNMLIRAGKRLFVKKGEVKTLALKVVNDGAVDANKVWTEARLDPIVVPAP